MSSAYVDAEVGKIINDESLTYPLNVAVASAWILGNMKGINLKVLDASKIGSLSDYYVMASATNPTQAQAMADEITTQLKKHGCKILSKEGLRESDWILLDAGDIIVHIFLESARDSYALESLWKEAKSVKIPTHYYFSGEEEEATESTKDNKDRDFF